MREKCLADEHNVEDSNVKLSIQRRLHLTTLLHPSIYPIWGNKNTPDNLMIQNLELCASHGPLIDLDTEFSGVGRVLL